MNLLFFIVGESGCGKSTIARTMADKLRAKIVNVGDLIVAELLLRGVQCASRNDAGVEFLRRCGEHGVFELISQAERSMGPVIVDGLRIAAAHSAMKRRRDVVTMSIACAPRERQSRLAKRREVPSLQSPFDDQIAWIRARADFHLDTTKWAAPNPIAPAARHPSGLAEAAHSERGAMQAGGPQVCGPPSAGIG
jgi:shikimate kinase